MTNYIRQITDKERENCRRKKVFTSEARARVIGQSKLEKHGRDELYVYRCPACAMFHLTTAKQTTNTLGGPVTRGGLGISREELKR